MLDQYPAADPRYVDILKATDPWPRNPGEKKGLLVETTLGKGTCAIPASRHGSGRLH